MSGDLLYTLNEVDPRIINGKVILITGGTGSFGNKMTETLLRNYKPKKIIIYSRDEYKQSLMKEKFNPNELQMMRYYIGDVRDLERLEFAFTGVDIVFHTAALKRIGECEYNPMEAIRTNLTGTENVIKAAIKTGVKNVIGLSTDKACSPVNLYGATKLCAEKLLVHGNILSGSQTKFAVVRYGNQLCSRGSLVEIFKRQKESGQELTVTDPSMTRFTILLQEAANFVLMCLDKMVGGEIFIPKLPSYSVEQMVKCFGCADRFKIIGTRPGEKMHELMISADESHMAYEFDNFFILVTLEEHRLQIFDLDAYGRFKYSKRDPQLPYSSGINELITNERLCRLIEEPLVDDDFDEPIKIDSSEKETTKTFRVEKPSKKLQVKIKKVGKNELA